MIWQIELLFGEWPLDEIKNISFNEDKSLFFIGTFFGELFVIDTETGYIKRSAFPHQFREFKTSDSGNTFLLEVLEGERVFSHQIYQVEEKCIQPMSSFSTSLETQFQKFIDFENPLEDSFLSFLIGVLSNEELVKKNSKLILPLLWKVLLSSPDLYLDLHSRYASLKLLPPFPAVFINDENQDQVKKALRSIFETQIQFRHSQMSQWDFVKNLELVLYVLSEEKQDFYIEKITESISNGAGIRVTLFQNVFQSKLFYVIYSHVKSWFGRGYTPVSDITVARKKNSFLTLILSSEPIKNTDSIKTPFGIHYFVLEDLSRDLSVSEFEAGKELVNDSVEWTLHQGASYRADLKINIQEKWDKNFVLTQASGPNYKNVWQDQKMTGLIIIGSSLRSFSKNLLENYLAYFKSAGFQFSSLSVPDFQPFLKEKIGSCELDYFLKESHSDGDERNVFRFDSVNSVLKGIRRTEEGQTEVVYLAFPKPFHFGKPETALFSNLDLAELIQQRAEKGCGEITYFNTSCWSHVKARYEIESVYSPLLLNIPSKSLSDTFLNQEGDAIRELIESYRKGLNFEGFRKSLEKNEGYKSGKINRYLFPDEREYYDTIFKHISIPLKISIDLKRKEGDIWKSISPDEAL